MTLCSMIFEILVFVFLIQDLGSNFAYKVEPGPKVRATQGEVWPRPQQESRSGFYLIVDSENFQMKAIDQNCHLLSEAIDRYMNLIEMKAIKLKKRHPSTESFTPNVYIDDNFLGYLNILHINLSEPCELHPQMDSIEKYELELCTRSPENAYLHSESIWGVLRGIETFSQLLYEPQLVKKELMISCTVIEDYPRFSHRGLLLDTARHFISLPIIYQILEAMAYNKLNVFHWHIVDDQSFPYESTTFPKLSEHGAYGPNLIYTRSDIKRIIEFARLRGIRVIAEFDSPGHTRSWGEGYRYLLTKCYTDGRPNGYYGPINPIKRRTYDFLDDFLSEIIELFPDQYVHLGGDEVDFDCWKSNPQIVKFMKQYDMKDDFKRLENLYFDRIIQMIRAKREDSVMIVWDEVFQNRVQLPSETIVQVWTNLSLIDEIIWAEYRVVVSACWYLDRLSDGGDWTTFYGCDPAARLANRTDVALIVGGEACMWSEAVNDYNVLTRIWPRASAVAERLWSHVQFNDVREAAPRLEEHHCRMIERGIPSQPPNGAGVCNHI